MTGSDADRASSQEARCLLSPATRRRLHVQGFVDVDDATLAQAGPWLRLAPALCAAFGLTGTLAREPAPLWGLAGVALAGAVLPRHPFEWLYEYGLRHVVRGPSLPPNPVPRRFACALASVWLVATGAAFASGAVNLALVLGLAFTGVASLVSMSDICIPSMIFGAVVATRQRLEEGMRHGE